MIGLLGYYKEIDDLRANNPLIFGLDKVVETLNYDIEKCGATLWDENITQEYAKSRVSQEVLNE